MARAKQTPQIHQMTEKQWEVAFPNEEACDLYLISHRWPDGVCCPRCGSEKAYPLASMKFKWECPDCREGGAYRFSHLVGTIFENTKIDLRDWFKVINLMLTSKKGMSARQVWRYMGFGSLKTAWYMCHRIRAALQDKEFKKLMGTSKSMKLSSAAKPTTSMGDAVAAGGAVWVLARRQWSALSSARAMSWRA